MLVVLAFVAWSYVGTLVFGLFVYYATRPVMERVAGRVASRTLAAAVALLAFVVPALLLFAYAIAVALTEVAAFVTSEEVGETLAVLEPYLPLSALAGGLDSLVRVVVADPARLQALTTDETFLAVVEATLGSVGFLGSAGLHAFIVLVVSFYLLRDDYRIVAWARSTFLRQGSVAERYFVVVDEDLRSVYFGNIVNAAVTGLLAGVVFNLLNLVAPAVVAVPQPTLVGLLVGVASLVPVVGIKLVWVPVALVLAAVAVLEDPTTLWFVALFAVVSVVVVDWIPDQVLRPFVSGRNVHVGAIMLAYIFGPLLWGWYGIFLGPLVLVLGFEFGRVVAPWLADPRWTEFQVGDATTAPDADTPTVPDADSATDRDATEESRAADDAGPTPDDALGRDPTTED
nr:AI-2E family transporter [Halomarina rubra]